MMERACLAWSGLVRRLRAGGAACILPAGVMLHRLSPYGLGRPGWRHFNSSRSWPACLQAVSVCGGAHDILLYTTTVPCDRTTRPRLTPRPFQLYCIIIASRVDAQRCVGLNRRTDPLVRRSRRMMRHTCLSASFPECGYWLCGGYN